mmetsp:Transcript_57857/g.125606  ORF Transcript_57857/g.125606 Transcript_57857/m.125606 type:complete len:299 (-) Transcript_57857:309-1205(-)
MEALRTTPCMHGSCSHMGSSTLQSRWKQVQPVAGVPVISGTEQWGRPHPVSGAPCGWPGRSRHGNSSSSQSVSRMPSVARSTRMSAAKVLPGRSSARPQREAKYSAAAAASSASSGTSSSVEAVRRCTSVVDTFCGATLTLLASAMPISTARPPLRAGTYAAALTARSSPHRFLFWIESGTTMPGTPRTGCRLSAGSTRSDRCSTHTPTERHMALTRHTSTSAEIIEHVKHARRRCVRTFVPDLLDELVLFAGDETRAGAAASSVLSNPSSGLQGTRKRMYWVCDSTGIGSIRRADII